MVWINMESYIIFGNQTRSTTSTKIRKSEQESNYQKYGTQTKHEHECECPKSPSFVESWQQDLELMESGRRLGLWFRCVRERHLKFKCLNKYVNEGFKMKVNVPIFNEMHEYIWYHLLRLKKWCRNKSCSFYLLILGDHVKLTLNWPLKTRWHDATCCSESVFKETCSIHEQ